MLAICLNAASKPSTTVELSRADGGHVSIRGACECHRVVCGPTWATVRFVLPSADGGGHQRGDCLLLGEERERHRGAQRHRRRIPGRPSPGCGRRALSRRGLRQRGQGHAASAWTMSPEFATAAATATIAAVRRPASGYPALRRDPDALSQGRRPPTSGQAFDASSRSPRPILDPLRPLPGYQVKRRLRLLAGLYSGYRCHGSPGASSAAATASASAPASTAAVPYAPALSSYNVLAQSYSATTSSTAAGRRTPTTPLRETAPARWRMPPTRRRSTRSCCHRRPADRRQHQPTARTSGRSTPCRPAVTWSRRRSGCPGLSSAQTSTAPASRPARCSTGRRCGPTARTAPTGRRTGPPIPRSTRWRPSTARTT